MTQQSLITRLKAVEEALAKSVPIHQTDTELVAYESALSDLRKLIKEAEGQEPVARTVAEVTNTGYVYVKALNRSIPFQTNLYTALGEKP